MSPARSAAAAAGPPTARPARCAGARAGASSSAPAWCIPTYSAPSATIPRRSPASPSAWGSSASPWRASASPRSASSSRTTSASCASSDPAGRATRPVRKDRPMKLPLSWLRDWIEFEGTPERVADALTRRGFYVEGIETRGRSYPGVVIARVLEVAKHPNADRLSLCRVSDGAAEMRVVCGAPNVRAGMIAPLATVGAKLPGGMVIQKSKIRGEESQGMLCSARELQLSDDHDGIVDLERLFAGTTLTPGQPLDSLFGPADTVLEV